MGLRMKNFNIMGFHWKIRFLDGWSRKSIYNGKELPKKVELRQFADLRRGLAKKGGGEGGMINTSKKYHASKLNVF